MEQANAICNSVFKKDAYFVIKRSRNNHLETAPGLPWFVPPDANPTDTVDADRKAIARVNFVGGPGFHQTGNLNGKPIRFTVEQNEPLSKEVVQHFYHPKIVEIYDLSMKEITQGFVRHSTEEQGIMVTVSLGNVDTTYHPMDDTMTLNSTMATGECFMLAKNTDNLQPIAPFSVHSVKPLLRGDDGKKKVLLRSLMQYDIVDDIVNHQGRMYKVYIGCGRVVGVITFSDVIRHPRTGGIRYYVFELGTEDERGALIPATPSTRRRGLELGPHEYRAQPTRSCKRRRIE